MEAFYGGVMSALGDVVYVTLNYRVGLFGFLDAPVEQKTVPGFVKNAGLYDQIAAIRWIRKNIHHFGGKELIISWFYGGAYVSPIKKHNKTSNVFFGKAILANLR